MKILVAGGAGYIGSVTTQMLCDADHQVVVFDNLEGATVQRSIHELISFKAIFVINKIYSLRSKSNNPMPSFILLPISKSVSP